MTIKKDEINVLVPESGKKIIVSFYRNYGNWHHKRVLLDSRY